MNTKGIKFLTVLAVLAMAFAAFAVIAPAEQGDATTKADAATYTVDGTDVSNVYKLTGAATDTFDNGAETYLIDSGFATSLTFNVANMTTVLYVEPSKVLILPANTSTYTLYSCTVDGTEITTISKLVFSVATQSAKITVGSEGEIEVAGNAATSVVTLIGENTLAGGMTIGANVTLNLGDGSTTTSLTICDGGILDLTGQMTIKAEAQLAVEDGGIVKATGSTGSGSGKGILIDTDAISEDVISVEAGGIMGYYAGSTGYVNDTGGIVNVYGAAWATTSATGLIQFQDIVAGSNGFSISTTATSDVLAIEGDFEAASVTKSVPRFEIYANGTLSGKSASNSFVTTSGDIAVGAGVFCMWKAFVIAHDVEMGGVLFAELNDSSCADFVILGVGSSITFEATGALRGAVSTGTLESHALAFSVGTDAQSDVAAGGSNYTGAYDVTYAGATGFTISFVEVTDENSSVSNVIYLTGTLTYGSHVASANQVANIAADMTAYDLTIPAGVTVSVADDTEVTTGGEIALNGVLQPVTTKKPTLTNVGAITIGSAGTLGGTSLLFKDDSVIGQISGATATNLYVDGYEVSTKTGAELTAALADGNVVYTGGSDVGAVTIAAGSTLEITGSTVTAATITFGGATGFVKIDAGFTGTISYAGTHAGSIAFSGFTGSAVITPGSVEIAGDFDAGTMTVTGTAAVVGDTVLESSVKLILVEGAELTVSAGNTLTVSSGATIDGYGTITVEATALLIIEEGANILVEVEYETTAVDISGALTAAIVEAAIAESNVLYLSDNASIAANVTISIPEGVTLYLNGYTLTVADKGELDVTKATIYYGYDATDPIMVADKHEGIGIIDMNGNLYLASASVYAPVDVDSNTGYTSITGATEMEVQKGTENVMVGYGNTIILNNITMSTSKILDVFGTLKLQGTNTISTGGKLNVYLGANAINQGESAKLIIQGTAEIIGTFTNEGTVQVTNDNGGAVFKVNGGYVSTEGIFEVLAARSADAYKTNDLFVSAGTFINTGSLKITGTQKGIVCNGGIMEFAGTSGSTPAQVMLYDGMTVTVTSVVGTLTIYDNATIVYSETYSNGTAKTNVGVSFGNQVVLTNVKGVTVTESVSVSVKNIDNDAGTDSMNIKFYVGTLSIAQTGTTVSPISDSVGGTIVLNAAATGSYPNATTAANYTYPSSGYFGSIDVGDMNLGKKVQLGLQGSKAIKIEGTVSLLAEKSDLNNTNTKSGGVVVDGMVVIGPKAGSDADGAVTALGTLAAAYYSVVDTDGNTTKYYMPLADALEDYLIAEDQTIGLGGSNKISDYQIIPADTALIFDSGAVLTITSSGELEVAKDGLLNSTAGTVNVYGKVTVDDKNTGIKYNALKGRFVYQVYKTEGDKETYSGILGALAEAESGDVITLVQDAVIDESAVIKEGVKVIVPKNLNIDIGSESDKVVLTVAGELDLLSGGTVTVVEDAEDVELIIYGVVASIDDFDVSFLPNSDMEYMDYDDYVVFEGKLDGRAATIMSNLTYATENIQGETLTIVGDVAAGVIELSLNSKQTKIDVAFVQHEVAGELVDSSMTVISLTIGNGVKIDSALGKITGIIAAESSLEDVELLLTGATDLTLMAYVDETATGDEPYLYAYGTFDGTVEVVEGVLTAGYNGNAFNTANTTTSILKVDEDATIVVAHGQTMAIQYTGTATNATVSGTILVNGTLNVNGRLSVPGTMIVVKEKAASAATVNANKNVTVTGSLLVSDDDSLYGQFIVAGSKLTIGTAKTSIGADAVVSGPITINNTSTSYVVVYDGADISEAMFNWNAVTQQSDAVSTVIYVHGVKYATAYAASSTANTVAVVGNIILSTTKIAGWNIADTYNDYDYWFTDSAMKTKLTATNDVIGKKAALYYGPSAAIVYGVVTVGTGIDLYVDGKNYDPKIYYGQDDSFSVGVHEVYVQIQTGYVGDNVKMTFNGAPISNGKFTITADMESFTLVADGATPYTPEPTPTPEPEKESEWNVTTILLLVLVILIAIMAVIVALRLNRS